jgi:putative ABC transport system permease protein
MTAFSIKALLSRRMRTVLTAFSIVLGVGMVSATFIFTDTVQKAFDGVFTSPYKHTTVVVSGRQVVQGAANAPTVPAAALDAVRRTPGVQAATGNFLYNTIKLVDRDHNAIGGGNPQFGFGIDPAQPQFNPLSLTEGSWARGPGQIVIGAATAAASHDKIGDRIGAKGDGPVHEYTITGLARYNGTSSGSATLAILDVPTAQHVLHQEGRFGSISVRAAAGVDTATLIGRLRTQLPPSVTVRSSARQAAAVSDDVIGGKIGILRSILLSFAGISLFVGAFVTFNTISMTVAQRTREFATLRTLGASRRQVLRSVLLESAVLGAVASVLGVAAGYGMAKGLQVLFKGLPEATTVVAPRTVFASIALGVIITVVAGLLPALRATRVAPISAVREGAVVPPTRFARYRPHAAAVTLVLAVALILVGVLSHGDARSVLVPAGAGTLLLFIGVAMVSTYLVGPLVRIVGAPARRIGGSAGRLAAANSTRTPERTASTAAALMIGLALVTFVAVLATGLEGSLRDDLSRQVRSDLVAVPGGNADTSYISPLSERALASVPGVGAVSGVRGDKARVLGETVPVSGIDGRTIGDAYRFSWTSGSDRVLGHLRDGAIVDSSYAADHHLSVGSRLRLETSEGRSRTFVVRATYHPRFDAVLPGVLIDRRAFDQTFPKPNDIMAFVNAGSATAADLRKSVSSFTDVDVRSRAAWIAGEVDGIKEALAVFYAFLALSVMVSLFGMVNTLVLSVFERTREIGMLRAVGMSRRQVRRMIRHESIITALIGAALAIPLGVFLAAVVTRGLSSQGVSLHVPWGQLAGFTVVAVVAGLWAAIAPARRAARLDVLDALHYG